MNNVSRFMHAPVFASCYLTLVKTNTQPVPGIYDD